MDNRPYAPKKSPLWPVITVVQKYIRKCKRAQYMSVLVRFLVMDHAFDEFNVFLVEVP